MKKATFFRRCHVCGGVNESKEDHVSRCEHCGKPIARFQYFDDRLTPAQGDRSLRPKYLEDEYYPVQGFTAYWEG